jgi:hypothetical protein
MRRRNGDERAGQRLGLHRAPAGWRRHLEFVSPVRRRVIQIAVPAQLIATCRITRRGRHAPLPPCRASALVAHRWRRQRCSRSISSRTTSNALL